MRDADAFVPFSEILGTGQWDIPRIFIPAALLLGIATDYSRWAELSWLGIKILFVSRIAIYIG